jgi:hypothetical protein
VIVAFSATVLPRSLLEHTVATVASDNIIEAMTLDITVADVIGRDVARRMAVKFKNSPQKTRVQFYLMQ